MRLYDYDLNLLHVFYEIVRMGSLSGAGRKLQITRSGVSQKLKALERSLDTQLIRRSTREIDLTESGKRLYAYCTTIFKEIEKADLELLNLKNEMQGHIRLCVPTSLGEDYFNNFLIDFIKENPNTSFKIIFSNRIKNFLSSEIDLALQITTINDIPEDYVAREIAPVQWCLCASPPFLANSPDIRMPEDLKERPFVTPTYTIVNPTLSITANNNNAWQIPLDNLRVQSESLPFLRKNVMSGQGIGLLPIYSVTKELREGALIRLLPEFEIRGFGDRLYVISTQTFHMTRLQRRFIDFVIRKLRAFF